MRAFTRLFVSTATIAALVVGGGVVWAPTDAVAAEKIPTVEKPTFEDPVPGSVPPKRAATRSTASSKSAAIPAKVSVPAAPSTVVDLPEAPKPGEKTKGGKGATPAIVVGKWQQLGTSGVKVAAAAADEKHPDKRAERIEAGVLTGKKAKKAGGDEVAITLSPVDVRDEGPVGVSVPDALFSGFGADFASRVRWVQVPANGSEDLADAAPVASARQQNAVVLTPKVGTQPTVLLALAGSSSTAGTGSYSATPLKSASTWDVTEQTGAFGWSYDMPVPDPGIGPVPDVGLSYNSQAVDGATASTNNQPSAVGEGWNLNATGFIERSYFPCAKDDGASGPVTTSGDLCWRTDNATVSIAGHSGALIKDSSSGKWRLQDDDGTRFEHLTGTAQGCAANGTTSTDCWRMTTTDGTQYYFGLNRLPGWTTGKAETASTWTVPVFGNDTGEPCHAATFAASSCMQAWRWNLDYVVDVHGNAQALYYTAETNKYAKNGSGATPYQRGGVLSRIEYGMRADQLYAANAAGYRVEFTYDARGRCNDATGAQCTTGTLSSAVAPAHPAAYPDVPFDQLCTGTTCSASQIGPSFFTNARLSKVETKVLVSGAYSLVDSWALSHSYPAPGDGTSPALWLTQVQRTGSAAGLSSVAEPPTVFRGTTMQNRVWVVDGLAPLDKWRLSSIKTSLGAVISVNYQGQQCTPAQASTILANLNTNANWCFPEWWVPGGPVPLGGRWDLFHKYPVKSIVVDGATSGPLSTIQQTQYIYGTPHWRYNDSPLTVAGSRTWNVFAGVDTVEVREGDPAVPSAQKVSQYVYYQGMNGDRAAASGGTKSVTVAGTTIPDERWFGGQLYRQRTIAGVGGAQVSEEVQTPWASAVTANDGTRQARFTDVTKSVITEPVSTGGNRTRETQTTFDGTYGYPLTVSTAPSDAMGTCVSMTYAAPNTTAWIIGLPSRVTAVAKTCANLATAQYPADLVSDVKTTYDGAAWGAQATKGLATSTQAVDRYDGGVAHWSGTGSVTFDALGRPLTTTDALGRASTTAYTPAASLPLLSTVATNPAPFSWQTSTAYEPTTGSVSSVTDPNGAVTTVAVDALGRTSSVRMPLDAATPSMQFSYSLSQTEPNKVETRKLVGTSQVSEFQFIDGLGRVVQTQRVAGGGGSVIKTTGYDGQGRAYFVDNDYWTDSITPGTGFFTPTSENNIPSQTVTSFDAVGRATKAVLKSTGAVRSQTVTAYSGADRVDTTPPAGGTATSVFTNSLGQKAKLTQYLSGTPTGTGQSTTYAYDGGGRMTKMTDPAGNQWTWSFDLLGHRVGQSDPDSGVSTATYDLVGNMTSATDARGVTVTSTFDQLNRKTATYAGTASGAKLSSWTYDTVKKGLVSASTSYVGSTPGVPGVAYTKSVQSYDAAGNPLQQTVSIPAGAPAFGGTSYATTTYYNVDSSLLAKSVPAVGGLPSEIIRYTYDSRGALSGVRGASMVLANTIYTPIGQLSQFNRYNGTNSGYSTYGYDNATGAVLEVKDNAVYAGAGHYVADRAYTWDDAGNVTSSTVRATDPTAQVQKACYSYDGLRQLTRAWTPNEATACTAAPSAASLGGPAPFWLEYAYDNATGNRKSVVSKTAAGGSMTSTFGYPAAGATRPHAVTAVTGGAGAGAYGYDAAGYQITRPGQTVTFNETGKVSKIVAGAETQQNVFDADGNLLLRTSTTSGAALFLGDTTLTQAAGSSVVAGFRTYAGAEGKPVAQRSAKTGTTGSTLCWLFTTLEGTVDVQTDAATGATVQSFRDPFGAPAGSSAQGWADSGGYMNKQVAADTGLTNVGARTYDPVLGKFLSVDPVIDTNLPQQNTGYTYSGNNPTTNSDPTGLQFNIIAAEASGGKLERTRKSLSAQLRHTFVRSAPRLRNVDVSHVSRVTDLAKRPNLAKVPASGLQTMINPNWISGSVNSLWGAVKVGSGIATLILGVGADITVAGLPIGIPATAVGAYQIVTGVAKIYRGGRQLGRAQEAPLVNLTTEAFIGETALGILPSFTSDLIDLVGGLI